MRFSIISEIPGRTRLQLAGPVPESDLDALLKLSVEHGNGQARLCELTEGSAQKCHVTGHDKHRT